MSELQKMCYDLIDFIFPDKFLTRSLEGGVRDTSGISLPQRDFP